MENLWLIDSYLLCTIPLVPKIHYSAPTPEAEISLITITIIIIIITITIIIIIIIIIPSYERTTYRKARKAPAFLKNSLWINILHTNFAVQFYNCPKLHVFHKRSHTPLLLGRFPFDKIFEKSGWKSNGARQFLGNISENLGQTFKLFPENLENTMFQLKDLPVTDWAKCQPLHASILQMTYVPEHVDWLAD